MVRVCEKVLSGVLFVVLREVGARMYVNVKYREKKGAYGVVCVVERFVNVGKRETD